MPRRQPPVSARLLRRLLIALALIVPAAFLYVDRNAPLDPSSPPHALTPLQLRLMRILPDRCPAALERAADIAFAFAPKPIEDGCGHPDGVLLTRSQVSYGGEVLLQCPAAVALVMWERHALQPAALEHFGRRVSAVRTFGTYACRNLYGREDARRSRHATADAIDIAAFTLDDGTAVSVRRDWNDEGARGAFLRAARDGACRFFGSVLSPDYNDAHADHFHFDTAPWTLCR